MTIPPPLPAGTIIGRYRITGDIGAGGMGTVYRAETTGPVAGLAEGDVVALKIIHSHLLRIPGFFKRFLRECEAGKRIRHPSVVATYDLDCLTIGEETVLYIAMEYVEGKTLWTLFRELGTIPEDQARHLARELAMGLQAIHEAGVVHRDVKPENVLIGVDSSVKLMDLGVARVLDEDVRLSLPGAFVGSALYAAPEQFRSQGAPLDGGADLYALGVVLYELISGTGPHDADDLAGIVANALTTDPRPLREVVPEVSDFLSALVGKLLAKDRAQRIGTAAELVEILAEGEESAWWRELRDGPSRAEVGAEEPPPSAHATAMVGRTAELAQLASFAQKAAAGEGRVVILEGETGIGKSRLVEEFVAAARARGEEFHYLTGAFAPAGPATSAFDTACRSFLSAASLVDAARSRFPGTPSVAAAFVSHLRGTRPPTGVEPLGPDALSAAFLRVFASAAAERPTIVFIDDLGLASREGLALFAAVAALAPSTRLFVIGATRPGLLPEDWLTDPARSPHVRRLGLSRLNLRDAALLLIAAVGSERVADELGFGLVESSGGNPFFLLEIVRSLRESGALTRGVRRAPRGSHASDEIRLPASVMDILRARLAAVADEDRDLLDMASRLGVEFDPRVVADAIGRDRLNVLQRLAKIERSHRLVHAAGENFVFDHRGFVEALCAEIPDALSREYDARLAAAVERLENETASGGAPADPARAVALTDLWLKAGNATRAMRYLDPALAHLDQMQSEEKALRLAARALAVPGVLSGSERARLLLRQSERLGNLGRRGAELDAAREAHDLALVADDSPLRARALAARGRALLEAGKFDGAIAVLEEALALATAEALHAIEADVRALLGQVRAETGRYDDALAEHERELGIRRKLGDAEGEAAAHGRIGDVQCELGRFDRAHASFRSERELGVSDRDRFARARSKHRLGRTLFALGRYDDARTDFARARTLWQLLGSVRGHATASACLGDVALAMGDPAEARRHFATAASLCEESGIRFVHGRALLGLACAAAAQSNRREAFRQAARSLELRREIGDRAGIADSLVVLGRLRAASGAPVAAKAALDEALGIARLIGRAGSEVLAAAHLCLLPGGDAGAARRILAAYATRTAIDDRIEAHTLLWRATGADVHREETEHLVARVLTHVPAELRDAAAARLTSVAPDGPQTP